MKKTRRTTEQVIRILREADTGLRTEETRLRKRLADQPDLAESILDDFRDAHRASQSRDVQRTVVGLKGQYNCLDCFYESHFH